VVVYSDGSTGFVTPGDMRGFDAKGRAVHPFWKANYRRLAGNSTRRVLRAAGVFHHRLGLAVDVELFVNPLDVGADGAEADAEFAGNLFVGLAAGKSVEHL
jgi:hypothetical protein